MIKRIMKYLKMRLHRKRMLQIMNERINYRKPDHTRSRNIVAMENSFKTPLDKIVNP